MNAAHSPRPAVETAHPPESVRAMEFPAHLETSIKRMIQYGQCCVETAEVLSGLLLSATLTKALREKLSRLRDGQRVLGREMLSAVQDATEAGKRREAGMLELPVTPSHNRPPATGRFAICETPACGNPLREAQAIVSLKRHGNRLCLNCEQQRAVDKIARHEVELPLEGGEMTETPQAFR